MRTAQLTTIQTKLHRPALPGDFVPRQKLYSMLNRNPQIPLVLVSAPAGYGKSTLISSWLHENKALSAWLSLDEKDSDLKTFVEYFISAVQTLFPPACSESLKLLKSPVVFDLSRLKDTLLNDLDEIDTSFSLVLDDYGFIHQQQIHDLLTGLLENPPQNFQLILITRRDPPLPLVPLRANGMMFEIRQNDLLFSVEETADLLKKNIDSSLDERTLSIIHHKIEGWAVGLRLVALSLRQRSDKDFFLRELKADNRHVQDYLISEVISRQQPEVRANLLKTAIPNRFCASLCDEIGSGDIEGEVFFNKLKESNLFCVFLDEQNEWVRYHHLFRDILLHSLKQLYSQDEIARIHQQSAKWFANHNYIEDALHHYLQADDLDAAGELIVNCRHELMNRENWPLLVKLLDKLPGSLIENNPYLSIQEAWHLWHQMRIADLSKVLDRVEVLLGSNLLVTDSSSSIRAEIDLLRSVEHYLGPSCDGQHVLEHAVQADRAIPEDHYSVKGMAKIMLAMSCQMTGDLRGAVKVVNDTLSPGSGKGTTLESRLLVALVMVYWLEGDLKSVRQIAQQLEHLTKEPRLPESNGIGYFFSGVHYYSCGDLVAAEKYLVQALAESAIFSTFNFAHSSFVLALTYLAQGHTEKAEETVEAVLQVAFETGNDVLLSLAQAFSAELAVRQGHHAETSHWVKQYDPEPFLAAHRFYVPQLTLVKILMARETQENSLQAAELLSRLETFFRTNHNLRVLIEIYALQALEQFALGEKAAALEKLSLSFSLAEAGGFCQVYLDLGPQMATLIGHLVETDKLNSYAAKLKADFEVQQPKSITLTSVQAASNPLSSRELDILSQLSLRLSNKEIAEQLYISPETVKRHTANIYRKLQANGRRQAIEQAISLGILTRS